jgi:hypothetical protein
MLDDRACAGLGPGGSIFWKELKIGRDRAEENRCSNPEDIHDA